MGQSCCPASLFIHNPAILVSQFCQNKRLILIGLCHNQHYTITQSLSVKVALT